MDPGRVASASQRIGEQTTTTRHWQISWSCWGSAIRCRLIEADPARRVFSRRRTPKMEVGLTAAPPAMTFRDSTVAGLGVKARHAAYAVSEHWEAPIDRINWDAQAVRCSEIRLSRGGARPSTPAAVPKVTSPTA